ncbi:MAG TPA: AraC family transcriptional regulator [Albitalea sp.]|uniref:AraC family transcriptional regulator n=1 Tax=Piscinibacter sp. TaxID=1903157 RepID=UPI002ED2D123
MKDLGECKVPVGMAQALCDVGLSPAAVLRSAGLPMRVLQLPAPRVPVADYFALWRSMAAHSGDVNIGIRLATAVKSDLTEPLFLAMTSSRSAADALSVLCAYKRLLSPEDMVLTRDGERVRLAIHWPAAVDAAPRELVDAELAFIVEVLRRGTARPALAPRELHLRVTALDAGALHAAHFRCPIRTGAEHDAIVFDAADLAQGFVTFNPQLQDALLPYLNETLPRPASPVGRVRMAIAERLRGQRPAIRQVARELAMSTRGMQRLLHLHGTSFRRLLDEVRREHAQGLLGSTAFSDSEVSFLLGFEEPSSFYRAFRTWTGMSPSEFRQGALTTLRIPT